jgi:hypothetical protein
MAFIEGIPLGGSIRPRQLEYYSDKGVMLMAYVTYGDLFVFVLVIVGVVALLIRNSGGAENVGVLPL